MRPLNANPMIIEAPYTGLENISGLIDAGVDIFYAGIDAALIRGGASRIMNRRSGINCNICSYDELLTAIARIHELGKKIYLAFNEHFYSDEQISDIVSFLHKLSGIDGLIVVDISLIRALRRDQLQVPLIGSVGLDTFNQASIDFYERAGVKEFVLPRQLTVADIHSMVRACPDTFFTVIIKNDDCPNIDGLCTYTHGIYGANSACCEISAVHMVSEGGVCTREAQWYQEVSRQNCRACLIPEYVAAGISRFKLAGRGKPAEVILRDVRVLRWLLDSYMASPETFDAQVLHMVRTMCGTSCPQRRYPSRSDILQAFNAHFIAAGTAV